MLNPNQISYRPALAVIVTWSAISSGFESIQVSVAQLADKIKIKYAGERLKPQIISAWPVLFAKMHSCHVAFLVPSS